MMVPRPPYTGRTKVLTISVDQQQLDLESVASHLCHFTLTCAILIPRRIQFSKLKIPDAWQRICPVGRQAGDGAGCRKRHHGANAGRARRLGERRRNPGQN